MKIKKIYENFEDFEEQLKKDKPDEIFYNYGVKSEVAQAFKEIETKDQNGKEVKLHINVNGQKIFHVISFCAQLTNEKFAYYYETTDTIVVSTQSEFEQQTELIKRTMEDMISRMQKNHPSSFLRKGTIEVV
jgi:hypothetical protein